MKSYSIAVSTVLFLLASLAQAAPTPTPVPLYDTLANRRPLIVLPTYTAAQKQLIADQSLYLIQNYYAHITQKETEFHVDPIGDLTALNQNASTLSDADLNGKIESVFSRLRDLHTNYYYPAPFACYTSALPISLEQVQLADGSMKVAISSASVSAAIVALSPQISQVSAGDVVVSFDGLDPYVYAQGFYEVGAGANPNAQVRRALQQVTARSHSNSVLPAKDVAHLALIKADGTHYEVDLNWISIADNSCLNPPQSKRAIRPKRERFQQGIDPQQMKFNDLYGSERNHFGSYISTAEPSIRYQLIQNSLGSFGMIKMSSFSPKSATSGLNVIADLLLNKFQNTKGLIIDLRNNGGGNVTFGERMLQFFTPKAVETENFQMLANQANRKMIVDTQSNLEYLPLIDQAIAQGQSLSGYAKLTPIQDANIIGQAYLKPVIVLTNSACFSTCDMFTAGMQDNGIATIIATDSQTGGGGANVIAYSDFASDYPQGAPNPFLALPGDQDMRVAWRKSSRVGKNAGVYLENQGCVADQTMPMTLSDLTNPDVDLLTKVTKKLNDQYAVSPAANTQVLLDTSKRIDFVGGTDLVVPAQLAGTSFVEFVAGSTQIDQMTVNADASGLVSTNLKVGSASLANLGDLSSVNFIGMLNTASGSAEKVWRKVVSLRRIPSGSAALPVQLDLASGNLTPFALYKTASSGWTVVNGVMRVGAGPNYPDDSHSEAALFLDLSSTATPQTLSFTSELHSEKNYDFFTVSVFADGKETQLIAPSSGTVTANEYKFDLSAYAGKKIEIRFTFESDSGVNGAGPLISKLSVQNSAP